MPDPLIDLATQATEWTLESCLDLLLTHSSAKGDIRHQFQLAQRLVAFGRPTLSAGLTRAHPRVEEVLRLQGDVVAWGRLHRHDQTPVLSVTGLQDPVGAADLVLWVAEASLNMLHASLLRPHPSLTLCRSQLAMAEATVGGLARCAPGTLTMRLHDILDQSQGSLAAWAASFRPDWGDRLASAVTIRRVHSLSA